MISRCAAVLATLIPGACTTPPNTSAPEPAPKVTASVAFPNESITRFRAPDGREWFLASKSVVPGKPTALVFTPGAITTGKWTEQLLFGSGGTGMSKAEFEEQMRQVTDIDKDFTYAMEDLGGGAFMWSYRAPAWNEAGVSKHQPVGATMRSMNYQNRLGTAGDEMLARWSAMIKASDLRIDQPASP